jgi:hypothetical protein
MPHVNMMSNETFVSEAVADSDKVILKEFSRGFVDSEHEFVCFRMVNEHQNIKSDVYVVFEFGEWECRTH